MKRRLRGGGSGVKSSLCDRILFRDIESLRKKNNYATIEQLVDDLRSTYPRHARHKIQPFTKCVYRVSNILNRGNFCEDDSFDNVDETPTKKLKRKINQREEKLLLIEAQHIKRRSGDVSNNNTGSSSSIASAASSESSSEASADAVYGEKLKPEFDLMKSMLRENYGQKFKELGEKREVQKAIELDVVENEDNKKVNFVNEGSKQRRLRGRDDQNEMNKNNKNSGRDIIKSNESMFKDLGGMSVVIEELKKKVLLSFCNPQLPRRIGVKPVAGILLYGPPGCGKTKLVQAIGNETKVPFYQISATELVSGVSGASEENIRELFSKANRTAPSIVFIDEIDAIASKRENMNREMERRIVTQLLTSMDEAHKLSKPVDKSEDSKTSGCSRHGHVLVIGATNRPDALDSALRRPGRFDREFELGVPDESARLEILSVLTSNLIVDGAFDLVKIARSTPGFVGADLVALSNEAGYIAIDRIIEERKAALSREPVHEEPSENWWRQPFSDEEMGKLCITMSDFEEAVKLVQPSSRREGFSTIPNVKWDDVGGLHMLRREFDRFIIRRIKYPEDYEGYGMNSNTGFLLYGPPGCGKTLIAKAVANEAGANFIHIKGPELLNKYVGESELAVRTIFRRARTCSPCIIFFDEVDALTTKRGSEGGWVVERPLTQLLIEMDGAEQRKGVYVIGATNRPEIMDRALLRPGRFGKLLYVPLPSPDDRGMILKTLARKKPIDADVDLMAIAKDDACSNFSGADLTALMDEALEIALEDFQAKKEEIAREDKQTSSNRTSDGLSLTIKKSHFESAFDKISPSVSDEQKQYYELLPGKMRAA